MLLVEAVVVGIVFMLLLVVMSYILYGDSNKKLLVLGFLTGSIAHLGFEVAGANGWYCKHGNACQKNK